ncbi:MAG: hemerythrin domain-containing protein [bacterium]|jgi:DUF438 domain-containing protein|nr:hemerythrin domain-containing protein [candidate division KSB1 bacterium]MDH7560734.1 hemerythrin domain-containing protein [bacterium]
MQENRALEGLVQQVRELTAHPSPPRDALPRLATLVDELRKVDLHYLRKENQLFPLLEKHEVSGPSQVMWAIHDDIRGQLKKCAQMLEAGDTAEAIALLARASQEIADMIYKEEHILFPRLWNSAPEEWVRVKAGEEEIGFAWIAPPPPWQPKAEEPPPFAAAAQAWKFDTGHLTPEQANLILTHLPVDLSLSTSATRSSTTRPRANASFRAVLG